VIEFGRGDTVVVLHGGWGGEHSGLIDAVRPLSDRFHFVLYDQRGSLRSAAPESTITVDRLVRDLDGLRRQLRQERITLLAHSMGSALSYAYLAKHPDRVRGLVLFAPVRPTDDAMRFLGVRPPTPPAWRSWPSTPHAAGRSAPGGVDCRRAEPDGHDQLHRSRADDALAHRARRADAGSRGSVA
jgi:pimeloyl-ACP methyl ester carboxylesterase